MTDARIADADRIGDIGDGWRVSMTTLMNERTTIGAASGSSGGSGKGAKRVSGIQEALDLWSKRPIEDRDPVSRDRIAKLWIESEVLHYTNQRAAAKARAGNPGPEGSIAKLALANMNKLTYELCIDLLGADGIVGYDYTFTRPREAGLEAPLGSARKMFLRARANSIEGGTSEIMRNILGERILGLPGEPRVDRDLPWSQVPRS
jgi:alkylation response protein AidB-like acyl-CoA dehydrogenase